jgi:hypothetical protein
VQRIWRKCGAAAAIAAILAAPAVHTAVATAGGGTTTRYDANGTFLLNGVPIFPLVLSKGPPRDGTTPTGGDALDEVVGAGVNFLKVGPATIPWTSADIDDANLWDRAAAARGAYTWVNLSTVSRATPGSSTDALLQQVITTLKNDPTGGPGIGMWKGADEPWWNGFSPASLRFAYCRGTSRGDPSWCSGEPALDSDHLWVTIEAPRGTSADLAPYTAVTDTHGVDEYPVTLNNPSPDLHQVGVWTSTMASITPSDSVWTTLQVCSSGSYDASGNYVLPTRRQERFMIYDAIVNGARSLGFYGGNNPSCWNTTDSAHEWSWTFWDTVLKGLIQEIRAGSPVAPALLATASNQVLPTSDSTTQAIGRNGARAGTDLWVFATRSGAGSQSVTISGLPADLTTGTVYTEGRTVTASNGSFTDTFDQWDAHVYHFASQPTAVSLRSFSARGGRDGVVLRWRTGSEAGIAGFDVYRGKTRLSGRPIPARGAAAGHGYVWLDRGGRVGARYRLRSVSLSGRHAWVGSIVAVRRALR